MTARKPDTTMHIQPAAPRDRVQVLFENRAPYEGPVGTRLQAFFQAWENDNSVPKEERAIAAIVDNRLRELTVPVTRDVAVTPVTLRHSDGNRIYRRTLSFLLVVAAAELFPERQVTIEHSLPTGAFFCRIHGRENLTPEELSQLKTRMTEIIEADAPIVRQNLPLDVVYKIFTERGDDDKVRLLDVREGDYLSVYELRGYVDYFFGYMAPSTCYVHGFDLHAFDEGFVLRFPRHETPGTVLPFVESPKLADVFKQTQHWLNLIGVEDIGQLNSTITNGRIREIIMVAEALHERNIAQIAQQIAHQHARGVRVALIAGPSSSGKTTFSKRLAIQLMTHGIRPFTLEMDNYFVDRELTPLDENGEYDFESLQALNVELLNANLLDLIDGKPVSLPRFDFLTGKSSPGRTIQISQDHVIILEGIHGMNPDLTPSLSSDDTFRIYVSALTQLNIDRHNRVPTTDIRLIRRIVRDARHRHYTAEDTLARWPSVRRGEKRNIFPYQENADIMFNSALVYELAVLRPLVEPLLLRVNPDSPLRVEAHRLLSFLRWVRPLGLDLVPDNSLLREFIGDSILRDYHPGS
ncbi:MAG: nucleoside kinase [Chloroflexi bacterium]|nr:nucleoside kinase [Chloroflexota bacterium]